MSLSTIRTRAIALVVLAALAGLLVSLLAPTAAIAKPRPGDPDYAYQLKVAVKPKMKKVIGSAEQTNSYNQVALQYKPRKAADWKVVAKRKGNADSKVVKVREFKARKGLYRTRISVNGIDCSSEPCTTKKFYYFSSVKRLR